MKIYIVMAIEKHIGKYYVEAESAEEAKKKVLGNSPDCDCIDSDFERVEEVESVEEVDEDDE